MIDFDLNPLYHFSALDLGVVVGSDCLPAAVARTGGIWRAPKRREK
jgi:hypothetical protein